MNGPARVHLQLDAAGRATFARRGRSSTSAFAASFSIAGSLPFASRRGGRSVARHEHLVVRRDRDSRMHRARGRTRPCPARNFGWNVVTGDPARRISNPARLQAGLHLLGERRERHAVDRHVARILERHLAALRRPRPRGRPWPSRRSVLSALLCGSAPRIIDGTIPGAWIAPRPATATNRLVVERVAHGLLKPRVRRDRRDLRVVVREEVEDPRRGLERHAKPLRLPSASAPDCGERSSAISCEPRRMFSSCVGADMFRRTTRRTRASSQPQ